MMEQASEEPQFGWVCPAQSSGLFFFDPALPEGKTEAQYYQYQPQPEAVMKKQLDNLAAPTRIDL
ncbi:hypothetical protein VU02_00120 [Desulfobulbus sp. N2]|nr:hypothetical protein [Desulfobulbus sp. N2]